MTETWNPRKQALRSRHGIVAAQNARAARAGAQVLAQGGNAMDAAVVTSLVLSVVEPWLSGIGGGGFLLHADGDSGSVTALDFNVRAPLDLDPGDYPLGGNGGNWFNWPSVKEDRNTIGYPSICVPGAIAGLSTALDRFGTLSWQEALTPAIAHAEQGLELDWFAALCLSIDAANLLRYPESAALFLDNGRAPRAPDGAPRYLPMPVKARTLRRLAQAGARDFYEGKVARAICQDLKAGGSAIRAQDLAAYQPTWAEPLTFRYRDRDVHAIGGLSGGPTLARALSDLERLAPVSGSTAQWARVYANVLRDAYKYRLTTMGHAARDPGCTSHVSVVDAQGNIVSLTNTLLSRFGSKVVLPQTGFLLNNGMMWFDPRPAQPNSMRGGAQPLANMCPIIAGRDGMPELAIGAAGGRAIVPAVMQLFSYLVDLDMSLEDAFHAPRIDASTPTIKVNASADADVAAAIAQDFPVEIVQDTLYPVNFAIPSAVARDRRGKVNIGMAHPSSPWSAVAEGSVHDG